MFGQTVGKLRNRLPGQTNTLHEPASAVISGLLGESPLTADQVSAVADSIAAVATVGTVAIAFWGLRSWKAQFRSQLRHDVGRRYVVVVYKLQDEIKSYLRWFARECIQEEIKENDRDTMQSWEKHVDKIEALSSDLMGLCYEVQAIWKANAQEEALLLLATGQIVTGPFYHDRFDRTRPGGADSMIDSDGDLIPPEREAFERAVARALAVVEGPIRY